jgi:hypothetical protein
MPNSSARRRHVAGLSEDFLEMLACKRTARYDLFKKELAFDLWRSNPVNAAADLCGVQIDRATFDS